MLANDFRKRVDQERTMANHTPLKPEEMPDYLRTISFTMSDAARVHLREIARRLEEVEEKAWKYDELSK
jgi:hypothetical protein